jgi:hypothetical protein
MICANVVHNSVQIGFGLAEGEDFHDSFQSVESLHRRSALIGCVLTNSLYEMLAKKSSDYPASGALPPACRKRNCSAL